MNKNVMDLIAEQKIYPIVRKKDYQKAIEIANALIDGGIKIMEITIENTDSYKAIQEISKKVKVCAGGIITQQQAICALKSGAKLFSSPIFQMNMVKISKNIQMPFIAGTSTPNEAYEAWKARVQLIKVLPATALGGAQYIADILRPMPFLNIMATGHIKTSETVDYLKAGATAVGIGRDLYEGISLEETTEKVKQILEEVKNI